METFRVVGAGESPAKVDHRKVSSGKAGHMAKDARHSNETNRK